MGFHFLLLVTGQESGHLSFLYRLDCFLSLYKEFGVDLGDYEFNFDTKFKLNIDKLCVGFEY